MSKQEEIRIELVTMIHTSSNEDVEELVDRILVYLVSKGGVLKVASVTQDLDCHYQPAIVSVESLILPRKDAEPTFNNSAKE